MGCALALLSQFLTGAAKHMAPAGSQLQRRACRGAARSLGRAQKQVRAKTYWNRGCASSQAPAATEESTSKATILVPEKLGEAGLEVLQKYGNVDLSYDISHDELLAKIPLCDALIVRSATSVSRDVFEAARGRLKVVGRAGVGIDNVDLEAATEHGCLVVNAPTANTTAAAEHGIAMMAALARHVPAAHMSMANGEWSRSKFVGVSLENKTLAVFGFGKVGSDVARRARGLGMKVVAHDPYASAERARALGVELSSFDDCLARADFMALHMPLTSGTKGLFNADAFSKCKDGVRIINVARGGVIDDDDLVTALDSGKVAGAAIDVFPEEPPPSDYTLLNRSDVVLTPHLGASTKEAQEGVAVEVSESVVQALNGELTSTAVNAPLVPQEVMQELQPYVLLADRLGRCAVSLVGENLSDVKITYETPRGDDLDTRLLRAMTIKGMVEPITDSSVNIVNADLTAEQRGLRVVEETRRTTGDETITSLRLQLGKVKTSFDSALDKDGSLTLEGRVVNGAPYLTRVGEFEVEVSLEGNVLMTRQQDQPGIIGNVSNVLSQNNINISFMTVSRKTPRSQAVMVIGTDEIIPEEVQKDINMVSNVDESVFLQIQP